MMEDLNLYLRFSLPSYMIIYFFLQSAEENRRNNERLKTGDSRILKLSEEVTRIRELNRKRNLPERDQLNKQLTAATQTLHEKEKEVQVRIPKDSSFT